MRARMNHAQLHTRIGHMKALFFTLIAFMGMACAPQKPVQVAPAANTTTPNTMGEEPDAASTANSTQAPDTSDAALAPQPASPENQKAAQALLQEGRAIQQQRGEGGVEEAMDKYQAAIQKDAQCAACYWELGWSEQIRSNWQACLNHWDTVRALDPQFPELNTHYPIAQMRRDQKSALDNLPSTGIVEVNEAPRPGPTLTIKAVGDVQMGRAWPEHRQRLPPHNAMDLFDPIKPTLQGSDLMFGNLETVLMDEGDSSKCGPKSTKCFAFRVPTVYAKAVKDAGFNIMSIANNHSGDFGEEGRKTTMQALDDVDIVHSGPVGDIATIERNGLRIGMVAFSTGGGVYRLQEIETAQRLVASLQANHDILIVSFHGGAEGTGATHVPNGPEVFYGESRGSLREFTHAVIDAGADIVIGHGPHVFRGMQLYKGRLIAYALGNFCTWETFSLRGALGITGVLSVELASNGVLLSAELLPAQITKPGRPKPDPAGRVIKAVRRLSKADFGSAFLDKHGKYTRPKDLAGSKTETNDPSAQDTVRASNSSPQAAATQAVSGSGSQTNRDSSSEPQKTLQKRAIAKKPVH